MPRKESITKKEIAKAAFRMARSEGIREVTARKLAAAAGCSTQPIFRVYANMEEVQADVLEQATAFFEEFYNNYPKSQAVPFVNLGLAYISFAQKESNLFQAMFLNENRKGKSLYELLNGAHGNVLQEIGKAKAEGCKDPQGLFMKMWIFIHGRHAWQSPAIMIWGSQRPWGSLWMHTGPSGDFGGRGHREQKPGNAGGRRTDRFT